MTSNLFWFNFICKKITVLNLHMSRLHITVENITNLAYKQTNKRHKNKQTVQCPLQEMVFWKCIILYCISSYIILCISLRYWLLYSLQIIFAFKPLSLLLLQHIWQHNADLSFYYYKLYGKVGNEIQQE